MSTWLDHMHREAIALAIPGWTWHEGDQVTILASVSPQTTIERPMFTIEVHVERPDAAIRMDRHFTGEAAAEFFNDLMGQGTQHWTSVFARFQVEHEETHPSLDAALKFLHDGWYTAERSPLAVKGPDGRVGMDREQIDADRKTREGTTP